MSLYSKFSRKGPTGFGYGSTAEDVTAGLSLDKSSALITGCNSGLGLEAYRPASSSNASCGQRAVDFLLHRKGEAGAGIVAEALAPDPIENDQRRPEEKTHTKSRQDPSKVAAGNHQILVGEKGAEGLSLKEAALRANVSRGVAYMHFDDRDQLLSEAQTWISERLQEGVKRFDRDASMYDRILYTTKLVLEHPEASKLMISGALAGKDLNLQHPLYKLVSKMLRQHTASGVAEPVSTSRS